MYIPNMQDLQQLQRAPVDADSTLRSVVMKAIWTAMVVPAVTTAAISGTGPTSQEKAQLFKDLQQAGLTVTNSGSTFTVGWGAV